MQNDSQTAPDDRPKASLNARLMSAGVKESYASMLARGHRSPSLDLALDLETKLGIPPGAWPKGVEAVKAALDAADLAKAEASQ